MSQRDSVIHLVAGGVAGTVGAIVTCPLEVVKTRQQSSRGGFIVHAVAATAAASAGQPQQQQQPVACDPRAGPPCRAAPEQRRYVSAPPPPSPPPLQQPSLGIVQCLRIIVQTEGPMALFKGLGPNLVGVAPSRAVYFATYSQTKQFWNGIFPPDSPVVHMCSASCAGFMAATLTNPIWFVKTRLQLESDKITAVQCVRRIYATSGILGFYKGITASYMGISETMVHFVIYEAIKAEILARRGHLEARSSKDFFEFMIAGAISKTVASCVAYPHEVARTRLREEGSKYNAFWQTLSLVFKEEGVRGLYRGLTTQLVRQIPNTAIMMATYEAVVYILTVKFGDTFYGSKETKLEET